jgi:uncharacterized protein YgbK (DUF1537 family)
VHWMRTPDGLIPVAHSEFARDASFGYVNSDLREWVAEKTRGRVDAAQVAQVTLRDIRTGGPERVQRILMELGHARPVVVDAVDDADLAVVTVAIVRAEAAGKTFVYRVGPSFVRARCGQRAVAPVEPERLARFAADPAAGGRTSARRGLLVVGSHVGLTTRQLDVLRARGRISELELEVPLLLLEDERERHVADVAARAGATLADPANERDVVIRTSRALVTGRSASDSLAIARVVSGALVSTVRAVLAQVRPAFVLAKGGITSSDTATHALEIRRAWARGTVLPGIVSVWEPVAGPATGIPFIVFAGNVGDDTALADVVALLGRAGQHGRS